MAIDRRIKQEIIDLLARLGIVTQKETGQVIIHLNEGGITRIIKMVEVK